MRPPMEGCPGCSVCSSDLQCAECDCELTPITARCCPCCSEILCYKHAWEHRTDRVWVEANRFEFALSYWAARDALNPSSSHYMPRSLYDACLFGIHDRWDNADLTRYDLEHPYFPWDKDQKRVRLAADLHRSMDQWAALNAQWQAVVRLDIACRCTEIEEGALSG